MAIVMKDDYVMDWYPLNIKRYLAAIASVTATPIKSIGKWFASSLSETKTVLEMQKLGSKVLMRCSFL